jgi:predicted transcriptional regulator
MPALVASYLRTHRKRWALTCGELGALLGLSEDSVALYELGLRPVPARVLIACVLIFGVSGEEIFPALYHSVGEQLERRVQALDTGRFMYENERKRELISGITNRLTKHL